MHARRVPERRKVSGPPQAGNEAASRPGGQLSGPPEVAARATEALGALGASLDERAVDGMGAGEGTPKGWGKELASFQGVTVHSNGPDSRYTKRGTYGLMYQCVEFVNRFCVKVHGVGNMIGTGNAKDYGGDSRKRFGFTWVPNTGQGELPGAGDILVFEGGTYGHVAIATGSDEGGVRMIQQNTRAPTATLGVGGRPGRHVVKDWGSLRLAGWQRRGPRKAAPSKDAGAAARRGPSGAANEVVVKRGDTLWGIAKVALGDGDRYRELARLNKLADPGAIRPGQVLRLPGKVAPPSAAPSSPSPSPEAPSPAAPASEAPRPRRWTVRRGDTLWEIAAATLGDGGRYREIASLNRLRDASALSVGQVLRLP